MQEKTEKTPFQNVGLLNLWRPYLEPPFSRTALALLDPAINTNNHFIDIFQVYLVSGQW